MEDSTPAQKHSKVYTKKGGREKSHDSDIPPGLSERDAMILRTVKSNAHMLDDAFHVCCFRFGWAFLLSFIPLIGDIVATFLSFYLIIRYSMKADLPPSLVRKMVFNNVICAVFSLIPIIGSILVGVWKVNLRNAAVLEGFLRVRGEESLKGGGQPATV